LHFQISSEDSYVNQADTELVLPEAAIPAVTHYNISPPRSPRHSCRQSEHHSSVRHGSVDGTPGPLWNLASPAAFNNSFGINQGSALVSSPDAVSALPNDVVDANSATYRKKIEGLKKDTGDSWLKIYSQGQENSGLGLSST